MQSNCASHASHWFVKECTPCESAVVRQAMYTIEALTHAKTQALRVHFPAMVALRSFQKLCAPGSGLMNGMHNHRASSHGLSRLELKHMVGQVTS